MLNRDLPRQRWEKIEEVAALGGTVIIGQIVVKNCLAQNGVVACHIPSPRIPEEEAVLENNARILSSKRRYTHRIGKRANRLSECADVERTRAGADLSATSRNRCPKAIRHRNR